MYFTWLLSYPQGAAQFGCPVGTLAGELHALGDSAAGQAAQAVELYLSALREQTAALGLPQAEADDLFVAVQGAYAVARTLNAPEFFRQAVQQLQAAAPQMLPQDEGPWEMQKGEESQALSTFPS